MLLAHGIGTRTDLPLSVGLAAAGAGLTVVITFAVLGVLRRRPRPAGSGLVVPEPLTRVLDHPALRFVLRLAATLAVAVVCMAGFLGPVETSRNIAPWALYITFWVGLVPASLLFGPVWRTLNPLRLLHAGLAALLRVDPAKGMLPLPERVGYWPAAVSLATFAWLELIHPERAEPIVVATFMLGYAATHTLAALIFGRTWFDRGDGFEAYSTLLGSLAPLGRRADGLLVLRKPLDGLESIRPAPGLVAVVVVLVGSTAFDGLSRTSVWNTEVPAGPVWGTVGLVAVTAAIAGLYLVGTWRPDPVRARDRAPLPAAFAHSLVPIAAGYAIAHYFSLLLFDGQRTVILASDPFGTGADLFGTARRAIDYTIVDTTTIALVQLAAIVAGHLVASVGAHDRALRLFPPSIVLRIQYPLLAAMVVLTCGAVGLIFAP